MDILKIGDKSFDVGFVKLKRSFSIEEKYRVTTENGRIRREISGIYTNYALTIGNIDADQYDALIETLIANKESQTVTMPYGKNGTLTFDAAFEDISDECILEEEDECYWDNLTVTFTAFTPREDIS